jgi:intracellular multiplication protein IcmK
VIGRMIRKPRFMTCSLWAHAALLLGVFVSASAFAGILDGEDPILPPPAPLMAAEPIAGSGVDTPFASSAAAAPDTGGNSNAPVSTTESTSSGGPSPSAASGYIANPPSGSSSGMVSDNNPPSTSGPPEPVVPATPLTSAPPTPLPSSTSSLTSNAMPAAPPPLPDQTLQNAVRTEAEQGFYERRRKRLADTFEKAYEGLVPLGPNEVRDVMGRYERTQKASIPPAAGQPRGQVRIKTLNMDPGGDPPTVNVSAGYVTTITILDATGQPWPIMDMGIGGNFEVSKTGAGGGGAHVVRIMPLTRFGYGNLSVLLQDLSTPIIFKLAACGTTVDYRFDARVPRLGPNAKLALIERKQLEAGSPLLMSFLDDSPPPDAKRVRLSGADARTKAWNVNERMFVRTPLTMLSPSWDASVSSSDGTTVYELSQTPVLLMSDGGALIRARVLQTPKED